MQGIGELKNKKINFIPKNTQRYISFFIDNLDFIDSLRLMNASLDELVSNISKNGAGMFSIREKHIDDNNNFTAVTWRYLSTRFYELLGEV